MCSLQAAKLTGFAARQETGGNIHKTLTTSDGSAKSGLYTGAAVDTIGHQHSPSWLYSLFERPVLFRKAVKVLVIRPVPARCTASQGQTTKGRPKFKM